MIEPTEKQRQAKARFWQKFEKNPLLGNPEALSGPQICQLAGNINIYKHLREKEELWNWFFDKDYAVSVLHSGLEIAVRALIETCVSPVSRENPAAARIKAAETLLKYGGMDPKHQSAAKFKDDQLDNMDQDQLEKLIQAGSKDLKVVGDGEKAR
jgi:hypothetical protein